MLGHFVRVCVCVCAVQRTVQYEDCARQSLVIVTQQHN